MYAVYTLTGGASLFESWQCRYPLHCWTRNLTAPGASAAQDRNMSHMAYNGAQSWLRTKPRVARRAMLLPHLNKKNATAYWPLAIKGRLYPPVQAMQAVRRAAYW